MVRLLAATLLLSAGLLFSVQPLTGKLLLPLLGGTAVVWAVVTAFFQVVLLCGYGYAHLLGRAAPRVQLAVHLVVLALGLAALPISLGDSRPPVEPGAAITWLVAWLTVALGLPALGLATTAPLLQGWLARTDDPAARDPYFLYAASNVGSLGALLAYPLLLERFVPLPAQTTAWSAGFGGLVLLVLVSGVVTLRRPAASAPAGEPPPAPAPPPSRRDHLRWIALAAVPSALSLGVTTHLSTDVSAMPLLWVLPLALYLATWVVAFSRRAQVPAWLSDRTAALALPLVITLAAEVSTPLAIPLHLLLLAVCGVALHGRLAAERPAATHLTGFYLDLALGGALGGTFVALVAPVVFSRVTEYPLAIVAAVALLPQPGRPASRKAPREAEASDAKESDAEASDAAASDAARAERARRERVLDLVWPAGVALIVVVLDALLRAFAGDVDIRVRLLIAFAPAAIVAFMASRRPLRYALALGALILVGQRLDGMNGTALHGERSHFGVLRVTLAPGGKYRWLVHGGTVHGAQAVDPSRAGEPLTYYHRAGPAGDVLRAWRRSSAPRRVGAVGLGVGSLAAYGERADAWTFFEIDPAVERIARDARWFGFLRAAEARGVGLQVVLGDGRLRLADHARRGEAPFGLLVLDAFSSDSIPVHLLTREALAVDLSVLAEGGLIAAHVSNRHLDLVPALGALAADAGLVCRFRGDGLPGDDPASAGAASSTWVVMARRIEDLGPLAGDHRWQPARKAERAWTDDRADVLSALRWD